MEVKTKVSILGSGWLGWSFAEKYSDKFSFKLSYQSDHTRLKIEEKKLEALEVFLGTASKISSGFLDTEILLIAFPPKIRHTDPESYLAGIRHLVNQLNKEKGIYIIFCSSSSVYGKELGLFHEKSEVDETSGLRIAEKLISASENKSCILRLGGLMGGERESCKYLKPEADLNGTVNYVHREDVLAAIYAIMEQRPQGIFNLVSPEHPSRAEIYKKRCGGHLEQINPETQARIISSDKIMQALGFRFQYPNPIDFPKF
jgi:nucleoside-diphosphate-sugar epimerase